VNGVPPVLQGGPLAIAHRGGAGLAPENTLAAFAGACTTWRADMIEFDVRATRDNRCVVIHDATIDRTTDGTGDVASYTLDELQEFDAGYRFTTDGGKTFPFRGKGIVIPTIEQVFDLIGDMRVTIEVKIETAQRELFDTIRKFNATSRVVAAGMHDRNRTMFNEFNGAKSASNEQASRFFIFHKMHATRMVRLGADVFQVPEFWSGKHVVTPRIVTELKRQNVPVHVWTVNEEADMHRLIRWGVDGLVSDRPDIANGIVAQYR
jgi:glycerophosphoryl diester phosphodiesterase